MIRGLCRPTPNALIRAGNSGTLGSRRWSSSSRRRITVGCTAPTVSLAIALVPFLGPGGWYGTQHLLHAGETGRTNRGRTSLATKHFLRHFPSLPFLLPRESSKRIAKVRGPRRIFHEIWLVRSLFFLFFHDFYRIVDSRDRRCKTDLPPSKPSADLISTPDTLYEKFLLSIAISRMSLLDRTKKLPTTGVVARDSSSQRSL